MTSLRFEPWRHLVEAHGAEIAQALADDLGPIRARAVEVAAGTDGVVVTIDTGERDPMDTVWRAVVEISQLWPTLGPLALEVSAGDLVVTTSAEGMAAVVNGCDRGAWRESITRRG